MTETAAATAAAPSTTNPPPTSAVEAIEEDDEFEEFEPCQWDKGEEDAVDSQQWKVRYLLFYLGWMYGFLLNADIACMY
ncbi:hypothetical protein ACHAWO_011143 [Cyclotella atomus]|uniref:Uncharacterized protein n=1 Tax=Cyclotella atomus TaxID=382360 RepID=A0ABD3NTU2_9STRA